MYTAVIAINKKKMYKNLIMNSHPPAPDFYISCNTLTWLDCVFIDSIFTRPSILARIRRTLINNFYVAAKGPFTRSDISHLLPVINVESDTALSGAMSVGSFCRARAVLPTTFMTGKVIYTRPFEYALW